MPSYKNQLTEEIIIRAFDSIPELKDSPYIEVEALYGILCQMIKTNGSKSGFRPEKHFDREIFEQILLESQNTKSGDNLFVKIQSFTLNLMRAQILLNQNLKSIHKHIQNLEDQFAQVKEKGRPANKFDPAFEEWQNLEKQLQEIKNDRISTEEDIFNLRLTFFQEDELRRLTKKLQTSKSNPYLRPLEIQKIPLQKQNSQIHSIGRDKDSPIKKLSKAIPFDFVFTSIFLLNQVLLMIQLSIGVLYQISFVNLFVSGFLELTFIKQKYSKVELKVFSMGNGISILLDFGIIFFSEHLWTGGPSFFMLGEKGHWRSLVLVFILCSIIVKLVMEILLIVQNLRSVPQQVSVRLICFSFSLKEMQRPSQQDAVHLIFSRFFD